MSVESDHEMIFAIYDDDFHHALRCKHIERGEVCSADLSPFYDIEADYWYPATPNNRVCYFERHLFGMSDQLAYSADGEEHTMFSTQVRVVELGEREGTISLEEDPAGESVFKIVARCESPELMVDGNFMSSVDFPVSVIMVYPIEWVELSGVPMWKSIAPHRVLRPGDVEWDEYVNRL